MGRFSITTSISADCVEFARLCILSEPPKNWLRFLSRLTRHRWRFSLTLRGAFHLLLGCGPQATPAKTMRPLWLPSSSGKERCRSRQLIEVIVELLEYECQEIGLATFDRACERSTARRSIW